MGTFLVRMGSVISKTVPPGGPGLYGDYVWYLYPDGVGAASDPEIITVMAALDNSHVLSTVATDLPATDYWEIMCYPDATAIELDTGTVAYAGLPAGFTITELSLSVRGLSGSEREFYIMDSLIPIPVTSDPVTGGTFTYTFPTPKSPLLAFNGAFGVRWTNGVQFTVFTFDEFYMSGTYGIFGMQWLIRQTVIELPELDLVVQDFLFQDEDDPIPEGYVVYDGEPDDFEWWVWIDGDGFSRYWLYQQGTPGTGWVIGSAPDPNGWWLSTAQFGGTNLIVAGARPKDPRDFLKISAWATGTAGAFGGSPASSCMFQNRMIYAANNYTSGTDFPPIRIFDGNFDRELCRLPPTGAGAVPKGILSMLVANGTIYVSTFDSGTSSADWAGRVFELDIDSGTLIPIGAAFASGQMPYALAWHNGRLWVGTNRQVSTATGKIYWLRPDIDTAWTVDRDLSTDSLGGVTSMFSFQGVLYVGTSAPAATFAKVLKRAADGTYSTALTATGGTAAAGNAFLSLRGWDDLLLYAGYWNNDSTPVAKIYRLDDTATWTAKFTAASAAQRRPIVSFFTDAEQLYAIGGGMGLTAMLLATIDGETFTDLTTRLPETTRTALPAFGVLVL